MALKGLPSSLQQTLQEIAKTMDLHLNRDESKPRSGFVLLVFPLEGEAMTYVSNCERKSVHAALKQVVAQWDATRH